MSVIVAVSVSVSGTVAVFVFVSVTGSVAAAVPAAVAGTVHESGGPWRRPPLTSGRAFCRVLVPLAV